MTLIKYLRKHDNTPYGVVVATDRKSVGFALCHPRDTFNKKKAVMIAAGRSVTRAPDLDEIPHSVKEDVIEQLSYMYDRSIKYFK